MKQAFSGKFGYAAASLVLFFLHLPLLAVVRGEFTDGVLQSAYFDAPLYVRGEGIPPAKYVPPLYPWVVASFSELGIDRLAAGRLVSTASYAICAFFIALIAAKIGPRLVGREGRWAVTEGNASPASGYFGWLAWFFWAFSPMANRWSFHCMSDMLFCCLATISLVCFLSFNLEPEGRPVRAWGFGNLIAVAALWTRFQGAALVPVSVLSLLLSRFRREKVPATTMSAEAGNRRAGFPGAGRIVWSTGAVLVWSGSFLFLKWGGSVHGSQFAERAVFPWTVYSNFALAGFRYLPYAVTPPLLLLAAIGVYLGLRAGGRAFVWTFAGLAGALAGLVVHTFFLSFQFRYGLPLLPWICVLGAVGTAWIPPRYRTPAVAVTLIWLIGMSTAVVSQQHETFADIETVCRRIPEIIEPGNRVWGFEEYNWKPDGSIRYGNIKFSVWSGRRVDWLGESNLEEPLPGDLVIESNVYPSRPPGRTQRLRKRTDLAVVAEATSETVPLFPGEILWVSYPTPSGPRMIRGTSDPQLMRFRFRRQFYSTVLYRVRGRGSLNRRGDGGG